MEAVPRARSPFEGERRAIVHDLSWISVDMIRHAHVPQRGWYGILESDLRREGEKAE